MVVASKKKNEVVRQTPEQKRERELGLAMEELEYAPEPTYFFVVGDRVEIGNLVDVYVSEVLEDGKLYEIDYTKIDHNYGKPITNEHQKMFVMWYRIRPYKVDYIEDSFIKNREMRMNFMQMHLSSLLSKVYHFGVDFNPDYQRDFVWDLEDKVALIDSIFNNVEIGKFAFIHKDYDEKYLYEILDGKQRLRTILDFYENRFPYKGKYYNDLTIGDRSYFENYPVSVAEAEEMNRENVLRYFINLNKNGRVMSKDQISKVEEMLKDELKSK